MYSGTRMVCKGVYTIQYIRPLIKCLEEYRGSQPVNNNILWYIVWMTRCVVQILAFDRGLNLSARSWTLLVLLYIYIPVNEYISDDANFLSYTSLHTLYAYSALVLPRNNTSKQFMLLFYLFQFQKYLNKLLNYLYI